MMKLNRSSDSSSEFSANDYSQQESYSYTVQRKRKNKKLFSKNLDFVESSPNMRFSRNEEKKFSEKNHIAYLGLDNDRGCEITWNVINISTLDEIKKEKLFQELSRLKDLQHENINTLFDIWRKDENSLIFITDSIFGGSLRQYLYKIGIQKLKIIKGWIKNILLGLDYLHKNGLVIRNLNCGRIYYNNNNGMVSIGDLYVASPTFFQLFTEKEHESFAPNCMSAEVIMEKNISEKSDIYSLGMVLIEMITIEIPYYNLHANFGHIKQKIKEGVRPTALDRITDDVVKQFILKLIDFDPDKRPTVSELLKVEFLITNQKEDNRKIKLIKLKKKRKKNEFKSEIDVNDNTMDAYKKNSLKEKIKKNTVLFKHDFEEVPYFEESLKRVSFSRLGEVDLLNKKVGKNGNREDLFTCEKSKISSPKKNLHMENDMNSTSNKESNTIFNQVTSSHEGVYTHHSDVYHTANTDYMNPTYQNKKVPNLLDTNKVEENFHKNILNYDSTDKNLISDQKILKSDTPFFISNKQSALNLDYNHLSNNSHPYQIFDTNYNVHLKFLINQDNKLHEIQFTYNLLRDSIPDLMEEIQNEFNFSHENLNHIYEALKKISIYSKFYKTSDILHDNSA